MTAHFSESYNKPNVFLGLIRYETNRIELNEVFLSCRSEKQIF